MGQVTVGIWGNDLAVRLQAPQGYVGSRGFIQVPADGRQPRNSQDRLPV